VTRGRVDAVRLRPMTTGEYEDWRGRMVAAVAAEIVAWEGVSAEEADARSRVEHEVFAPAGADTPRQRFCVVEDAVTGWRLGDVWYGPVEPPGVKAMLVSALDIDEEHRGRGAGSAAIRLIEEEARAAGLDRVDLWTFSRNTDAIRFYERLGFRAGHVFYAKRLR